MYKITIQIELPEDGGNYPRPETIYEQRVENIKIEEVVKVVNGILGK